jgi:hypothetical protein
MSLLPQQKKSAEEIAKLRETHGVHEPSSALETSQPESEKSDAPGPLQPLRRSEQKPMLAREGDAAVPAIIRAPREPKRVRSLRKSEQIPLSPVPLPSPDSTLPTYRHSEKQIQQLRLHESFAAPASHLLTLKAHPILIIPGYLFAIAAAVGYHFYDLQIAVTASSVAGALLFAIFIYFRKPLSLHHAAFIAVMSLFVIVFGALHYFPQLRHGT